MFHHQKKTISLLLSLSCLLGVLPNAALAQHAYPATGHSLNLETAGQGSKLLKAVKSGFEAYDGTPLGNRMPLVLVHGIGESENTLFHWDNFLEYASRKQDFQSKYKIYLYHYDSSRSVPDIGRNLQTTLKGFVGALGGRKIKILAYSEGGLLVRNALQDKYLDDHTEEVLAIATPFHGSPLANPEWIQRQVKTESAFSLVRMGEKIAYKITGHKYPTFQQDFHWDNFDGAIPPDVYLKNNGPIVHTDYALAKKRNFVTYGSYFGMQVDPSVVPRELGLTTAPPKERPMPGNLLRKNFLFSLVRNNIGRLPLAGKLIPAAKTAESKHSQSVIAGAAQSIDANAKPGQIQQEPDTLRQALAGAAGLPIATSAISPAVNTEDSKKIVVEPVSMMMFNDGISPISSTLWLGRYVQNSNGSSMPVDNLWSVLKTLKGNKGARLFAGLDHRNWMDGTTRTGEPLIQDLLNPDEPPRPIFEWIVYDLMS